MITISGGVAIADFDELPVPFRAVATNLETGAMRVFERGDLARVMRASMSVPGAFAPVQVDGQLYVDGGLVRNLPVDVARAACADVVIAVNLGTPRQARSVEVPCSRSRCSRSISSTKLDVSQSLTSLKETDVLDHARSHRNQLRPISRGFSRGDPGRRRGGARQESDRLLALQLPEPEYAAWLAGGEHRAGAAPVPVRRSGSRPTPRVSIRR